VPSIRNFKSLKPIKNIEDHYELGEMIGRGGYGTVRRAKHKVSEKEWALKTIFKSSLKNEREVELLVQEMDCLQSNTHPHIIDVKEMLHDDKSFYIATEICEGGELL